MIKKMRIIQWICGYTIVDRITNEVIRERVRVATMKDKMRENRPRWFGHVKRRSVNASVRKCKIINFLDCRRGRGRPKNC